MKRAQGIAANRLLFVALTVGLIAVGIAQAQLSIPTFTGKFTLTTQVRWDKTVLQPGDYTVTIESISVPTAALVRDRSGRPVGRFITTIDSGKPGKGNALLIGEKGGQPRVYSLALGDLGRVLVYEPGLAREAALEARVPRTVPVILARR